MTVGSLPDDLTAGTRGIPFAQIEEVTGIKDRATILNTWRNCAARDGSTEEIIADVISSLLSAPPQPPVHHSTGPTTLGERTLATLPSLSSTEQRIRSNSMETQGESVLTLPEPATDQPMGEGDDMQQAIAASLQGQGPMPSMLGGQVSREDQDISRVLEASLADNKTADGKKNAPWFLNHANPYDRRREDSWPVGLMNVGNTCWFNAVIQSLFHVEAFRDLVLAYEANDSLDKANPVAVFMMELRKLFALMLVSDRKYLDPSSVIEILKQSFSRGGDGQSVQSNDQQDVSEFQHKLLDWLEEAFQHKAGVMGTETTHSQVERKQEPMEVEGGSQEKNESNDMVKLFYGKVKTFGSNAGASFTTHTHFGQWPLYVAGFSDIHQSLEAGLAKGDIETNIAGQTSNQEQWFTRLPPLLTFELSRFSYNTMQLQAEKLHNRFSFPQTIYLDRYLESNREEVQEKRNRLWRLQTELASLEGKLHKYTHYGSGASQYPLHDILSYALEFTCTGKTSLSDGQTSGQAPEAEVFPQPKNISNEEFSVLTSCLKRWRDEVKVAIETYEHDIKHLKEEISDAYEKEHLKMHKYCLHAVLVHEGEAISGHYWSYIFNRQSQLWLKFNDTYVVESSWEEVTRESEGGSGKASAYCLIYTKYTEVEPAAQSTSTAGQDFPSKEDALTKLPQDLQAYAADDNERLQQEMRDWDLKKTSIEQPIEPVADIVSTTISSEPFLLPGSISTEVDDLACAHAQSMLTMVRNKYPDINKDYGTTITWSYKVELLTKICLETFTTHVREAKDWKDRLDTRAHFLGYLMMVYGNSLKKADLNALVADMLVKLEHTTDISGWRHVQKEAVQMSARRWQHSPDFQYNYIEWHKEFNSFRVVLFLFVEGVQHLVNERFEEALPYLHDAYTRNLKLIQDTPSGPARGSSLCNYSMKHLDRQLLGKVRNTCVQKFNEMAFDQFENEEDFITPLRVMLSHVLPILDTMQVDGCASEDTDFAGSIKERWVNLLVEESDEQRNEQRTERMEQRMERLREFMTRLFEPSTSPAPLVENVEIPLNLRSRCRQAMSEYSNIYD